MASPITRREFINAIPVVGVLGLATGIFTRPKNNRQGRLDNERERLEDLSEAQDEKPPEPDRQWKIFCDHSIKSNKFLAEKIKRIINLSMRRILENPHSKAAIGESKIGIHVIDGDDTEARLINDQYGHGEFDIAIDKNSSTDFPNTLMILDRELRRKLYKEAIFARTAIYPVKLSQAEELKIAQESLQRVNETAQILKKQSGEAPKLLEMLLAQEKQRLASLK